MLVAGTSFTLAEGWIVSPEGCLLLWIPIALYPATYGALAGNTLVIPNSALQIDLSCFAHGSSWDKCEYLLPGGCIMLIIINVAGHALDT
jgi:hypothetical protein